jgi:hypothetical protein
VTDCGTPTQPALLDSAQIRAREIILNGVLQAYGLPGHLRTCAGCGEMNRDCMCGVCAGCGGDGCAPCAFSGEAA